VERATRSSSLGYFFAWQTLLEACHSPPALSQSAWFLIVESDVLSALPLGLAEGDVDDPVDPPVDGADIEPELEPVPLLPEVPELLGWLPEPPAPLEPLPLVAPPWAAAITGTKHTMPIKSRDSIFFIWVSPPRCSNRFGRALLGRAGLRSAGRRSEQDSGLRPIASGP